MGDAVWYFQSMVQPLRLVIRRRSGFSQKDISFVRDRKKRWSAMTPELPKKKVGVSQQDIQGKFKELMVLERGNMALITGMLMILSNSGFQEIFRNHATEKDLLLKVVNALNIYVYFQAKFNPIFIECVSGTIEEPLSKISEIYTAEFIGVQKTLILCFPELFTFLEIFTEPRNRKKIEAYLDDALMGLEKMEAKTGDDIRDVIKRGLLLANVMQKITRRGLILKEIYEATDEEHPESAEVKRVYEGVESINLSANKIMRATDYITQDVNRDPYCLRELLS